MFRVDLQHIGKIDSVGAVQVFGIARQRLDRDRHDLIYLSYAGPPTASDAVWASLVERRALDFTDLRGRPHRLRHGGYPGLEGKQAPWKRFVSRIESLAIDHTILLDRRAIEPVYDLAVGWTFAFEGPALAEIVGAHVAACVDIAVFRAWYPDLLGLGQREKLVRPLTGDGHPVHAVSLDRSRWTTLISASVESGELRWPDNSNTIYKTGIEGKQSGRIP